MSHLLAFRYGEANVEAMNKDGETYFVAADVCRVLGIEQTDKAVQRLDDDEKLTVTVLRSGQNRQVWLISESGLYNLIFTSKKPEARAFRKWVTSEVLPALRRVGHYELAAPAGSQQETAGLLREMLSMQREHITLQRELIELIRPKPKRSRLSFTPEEKAVIAEMYDQGRSFTEICTVTGRAQGAIRYQIALITHARKEAEDARKHEAHTKNESRTLFTEEV